MTAKTSSRRVGILFSGGPAPSANAVIAAAASAFRRAGWEVAGFLHGYSGLQSQRVSESGMAEGQDFRWIQDQDLRGLRNSRGVCIGTARANPGKLIKRPEDLQDPAKAAGLRRVYEALCSLEIDALISIGGDDTLKTANLLHRFQAQLPVDARRVRVVHLPKTIDNDYRGIDFTFGYFTAVDVMAKEVLNLRADAVATQGYFIAECMGRKAGWLSYGVAVAGEAHMVVGVEDIQGELSQQVRVQDSETQTEQLRDYLNLDALTDRVVDLVLARQRAGKRYGVVILAEGLVEHLAPEYLEGLPRDDHGHISLGRLNIGKLVAERAEQRFQERTGGEQKFKGIQLGYEARCAMPHAFDVMLGSQLGLGAYRALVEQELAGHMVSITGQLELRYVPFDELIDPVTLITELRFIERDSDFHRLAQDLGTRL